MSLCRIASAPPADPAKPDPIAPDLSVIVHLRIQQSWTSIGDLGTANRTRFDALLARNIADALHVPVTRIVIQSVVEDLGAPASDPAVFVAVVIKAPSAAEQVLSTVLPVLFPPIPRPPAQASGALSAYFLAESLRSQLQVQLSCCCPRP